MIEEQDDKENYHEYMKEETKKSSNKELPFINTLDKSLDPLRPALTTMYNNENRKYNMFVFNVYTLLKCMVVNYENNKRYPLDKVLEDIYNIYARVTEAVVGYTNNQVPGHKSIIVFFISPYEHVYHLMRRKHKVNEEVVDILKKILSSRKQQYTEIFERLQNLANTNTQQPSSVTINGKLNALHTGGLNNYLVNYAKAHQVVQTTPIGMIISSYPIDYHIKWDFDVISTYTGKLTNKLKLGERILEKKKLPFTKETHILFGDSNLIKPLLQRNMKKDIVNILEGMGSSRITNGAIIRAVKKYNEELYKELKNRSNNI